MLQPPPGLQGIQDLYDEAGLTEGVESLALLKRGVNGA